MTDKGDPAVIEVRQLVDASAAVVFKAWTDPEHVQKWWRPNDTTVCTSCEIDPRVGGRYRIHMHDSSDQSACRVHGEFREISIPKRLVYTWNAETDQGTVTDALVTVEFHPKAHGKTEIVLRHSALPDGPIRQAHRETWGKILDRFAKYSSDTHNT